MITTTERHDISDYFCDLVVEPGVTKRTVQELIDNASTFGESTIEALEWVVENELKVTIANSDSVSNRQLIDWLVKHGWQSFLNYGTWLHESLESKEVRQRYEVHESIRMTFDRLA